MGRYEVFDLPVERVVVDQDRHPVRAGEYVLDHLIAFHRLAEGIPPIHAEVAGDRLVVVRAHENLAVARALGRPVIRAIVDAGSGATEVLADWPGVARVDVDKVLRQERAQPLYLRWHLLVFEAALTAASRDAAEHRIRAFFAGLADRAGEGLYRLETLAFPPEGDRLQFAATVRDGDHGWYGDFLTLLRGIDRDVAAIATLSGRRLP